MCFQTGLLKRHTELTSLIDSVLLVIFAYKYLNTKMLHTSLSYSRTLWSTNLVYLQEVWAAVVSVSKSFLENERPFGSPGACPIRCVAFVPELSFISWEGNSTTASWVCIQCRVWYLPSLNSGLICTRPTSAGSVSECCQHWQNPSWTHASGSTGLKWTWKKPLFFYIFIFKPRFYTIMFRTD